MTFILQIAAGVFLGSALFSLAVVGLIAWLEWRERPKPVHDEPPYHPNCRHQLQFLNPIGVEEFTTVDDFATGVERFMKASGEPVNLPPKLSRRIWSRNHPHCIDCKGTKSKHHAHGRCRKCNGKYQWRKANRSR